MRSGPAMGIARFRVCIMSNWTTHHHLGGPIRVNEVSSNTVRLLIKTSEVEKKHCAWLRSLIRLLLLAQFPYSALLYLYTTPHLARIISSERSRVALVRVHCPQLRHGTGQTVTTRRCQSCRRCRYLLWRTLMLSLS